MQYAGKGIWVNTVLPGLMNTPMNVEPLSKLCGDVNKMLSIRDAMCPRGEMGDAGDVANAVLYLARDELKYVTALELMIDGGLSRQVIAPEHRQ